MFDIVLAFLRSFRKNHWFVLIAGTILNGATYWLAQGGANPVIPASVPLLGGAHVVSEIILVVSLLVGTPLAPGSPISTLMAARRRVKDQQRDTPTDTPTPPPPPPMAA